MAKEKNKKIIKKLRLKYRLVILDEHTFGEKWSFRLSPLNVFIAVGAISLLLIIGTIFIIAYTPLKEYIPGYPDGSEKQIAIENKLKTDSLENELQKFDKYLLNLYTILNGGLPVDSSQNLNISGDYKNITFQKSQQDSLLRIKIENEEKYALNFKSAATVVNTANDNLYGIFFFTPLEGTVTQSFNPQEGHLGVDIITAGNEAVKATLEGTVIFAGWTSDGGHEIHIQHANNLVSVYRHNAVLLKKTGENVKAGDPIAIVGSSGALSNGKHLHFELWHRGKPLDPQNFIIL
jgi:murein DD-endopeptidase MepM/ murein hydrolase activator NlpD